MKRIEIIKSMIPELDQEKESLEKSLEANKKHVVTIAEHNEAMERSLSRISFLRDMYGNLNEGELDRLSDPEFNEVKVNIDLAVCSGQIYTDYYHTLNGHYTDISGYTSVLASTGIATGTATSQCINFHSHAPRLFIEGDKFIAIYKPKDELFENIDYIRNQLKTINPGILRDFEYLVKKLHLFSITEEQYQDIIGARSSFFLNFIFNRQSSTNSNPRREQIIQFVFGKTTYDNRADNIVNEAKKLWDELSSQDPNAQSVKTGNVSTSYIDSILTRMFGIIASLLKLRESYYS
ncbi:MAG: hypothetical protein AB2L13_00740 [Spirochaetota bacterium]